MGKAIPRQHIAQAMNDVGVTVEVGEAHKVGALSNQREHSAISTQHSATTHLITSGVSTQHTRKHIEEHRPAT